MTTTASATVPPAATAQPVAAAPSNTYGVLGIVLGILGIVLGQWLLSAGAIVLGALARSKEPHAITTANWALVLGLVGAFGWLLLGGFLLFGVLPVAFLGSLPFLFWPF